MSLTIQFWGVRGSLPYNSGPAEMNEKFRQLMFDFFNSGFSQIQEFDNFIKEKGEANVGGYGTATTCVSVQSPEQHIIIDAGTGLRNLGKSLMAGPCGHGKGHIHIFMTHFHWDHILGLPYFEPAYVAGNKINIYSVQKEVDQYIQQVLIPPFNSQTQNWKASVLYHVLQPRTPFLMRDMKITPYLLDHPDPCWGYKIECNGKVYAHATDTEATRVSRKSLGDDLPLYQGVDLIFFDGQYTLKDLAEKINWGHSAAQIGLDLALREGIRQVLFSHHDPLATSTKIKALERATAEYFRWRMDLAQQNQEVLPTVKWCFSYEGQTITL